MASNGKWPYFEGKQLFRKYKEFLKVYFRDFLPLWQECLVGKKVSSTTDLPSGTTLEDILKEVLEKWYHLNYKPAIAVEVSAPIIAAVEVEASVSITAEDGVVPLPVPNASEEPVPANSVTGVISAILSDIPVQQVPALTADTESDEKCS
jgi:hypothetical protein